MDEDDKAIFVYNRASEYAEEHDIPHRKALNWFKPYDFERRREFLQSLPEYEVVDIGAGGLIAIEDKDG